MSLSTWFRDYVYIPIGGNRKGNVYLHLLLVFLLTGLWHGAAWNFIVWGLWHGLFLMIERIAKINKKTSFLDSTSFGATIRSGVKWLYTMIVVIIGWVFFRASNLHAALQFVQIMFSRTLDFNEIEYILQDYGLLLSLGVLCMLPWKRIRISDSKIVGLSRWFQPIYCSLLLFLGIAYTIASTYNPFIYFNF